LLEAAIYEKIYKFILKFYKIKDRSNFY